jgi:hypothetical protein
MSGEYFGFVTYGISPKQLNELLFQSH